MSSRQIAAFLAGLRPRLAGRRRAAHASFRRAQAAGGGTPGDGFGRSVSASGNWIVVGAPGDDERGTDAGAVYIFASDPESARKFGTPPRLVQKLVPAELLPGDRFGWSVAIYDYTPKVMPYPSQVRVVIVVGAPGDDRDAAGVPGEASRDRGAAYVFGFPRWSGTGPPFTQETRLQPVELAAGDEFVFTVAARESVAVAAIYRDVAHTEGRLLADAGLVWTYASSRNPEPPYDYTWRGSGTLGRSTPNLFGPDPLPAPLAGARYGFRVGEAISDLADVSVFDGRRVVARDLPREFAHYYTPRFCGIATEPDGTLLVAEYEQTNGTWSDYKIPRYMFEVKRLTPDGRVLGSVLSPEFSTYQLPEAHDCLASGPTGTWMALKQVVYGPAGGVTVTGFSDIRSIDADQAGNAYVIDGFAVRRIARDGTITTVAGEPGTSGAIDGVGPTARFRDPLAIVVAPADVAFVGDGTTIRRVQLSTGATLTVAGAPGEDTQRDGVGTDARFRSIAALDVDSTGTLWIADAGTLRLMRPSGEVTTVAGVFGETEERRVDGTGAAARLAAHGLTVFGEGARLVDDLLVREASSAVRFAR